MVVQFSISLCLFISVFFSLSGSMAYFGCNFTNNTRCRFYLMPNSTAILYSPVDHQNSWSQVPQKNYPVIYTFQHRDIFIKNNKRAKTCFLFISRRFGAGNRPDPRDIQKSMATFPGYTVIMSDCLRNLRKRIYSPEKYYLPSYRSSELPKYINICRTAFYFGIFFMSSFDSKIQDTATPCKYKW